MNYSLILTFHEKRKKRNEAILRIWWELILSKQKKGLKIKPETNGWSSLARVADEVGNGAPIIGVDEAEYNRRLALCGYSALIYKDPPSEDAEEAFRNEIKPTLAATWLVATTNSIK